MSCSLDLISAERDLLTKFTDSFSQKQKDILDKYKVVSDRLATGIQEENDETAVLAQLQMQMDELTLATLLDQFNGVKNDLATKYQSYNTLVSSNNALASTIFTSLNDTKQVVASISSVISEIDANIAEINAAMDTYAAATMTTVDLSTD